MGSAARTHVELGFSRGAFGRRLEGYMREMMTMGAVPQPAPPAAAPRKPPG